MIKVVTDSSVDLPEEIARELDITIVPLTIHFGDRTYLDRRDIDPATFYRMLAAEHAHPRTAQPSVGLFEEAFRRLAAAGDDILVITIGATFSGTMNSAALAAQAVPDARVTLIDSGTVSMAMGSMVIRAARLGREGRDMAAIEATVRDMMPRLRLCLLADTLTYLQRGGRIGRAQAVAGSLLNIKPILTLSRGEVTPLARVRSRAKGLHEMVEFLRAGAPLEEIYVMHTAAPQLGDELAAMLQPLFGQTPPVLPLGPVVGVHLGPGSAGAIGLSRTGNPHP